MIKSVIKDYAGLSLDISNRLLGSPLLKSLSDGSALTTRQHQPEGRRGKVDLPNLLNPEQSVLQTKNQNQTVVTPLVYHLSQGLFREVPYQVDFGGHEHGHLQPRPSEVEFVDQLLKKFCMGERRARLDGLHRISGGNFFSQVQIDEESFTVSCELGMNVALSSLHTSIRLGTQWFWRWMGSNKSSTNTATNNHGQIKLLTTSGR